MPRLIGFTDASAIVDQLDFIDRLAQHNDRVAEALAEIPTLSAARRHDLQTRLQHLSPDRNVQLSDEELATIIDLLLHANPQTTFQGSEAQQLYQRLTSDGSRSPAVVSSGIVTRNVQEMATQILGGLLQLTPDELRTHLKENDIYVYAGLPVLTALLEYLMPDLLDENVTSADIAPQEFQRRADVVLRYTRELREEALNMADRAPVELTRLDRAYQGVLMSFEVSEALEVLKRNLDRLQNKALPHLERIPASEESAAIRQQIAEEIRQTLNLITLLMATQRFLATGAAAQAQGEVTRDSNPLSSAESFLEAARNFQDAAFRLRDSHSYRRARLALDSAERALAEVGPLLTAGLNGLKLDSNSPIMRGIASLRAKIAGEKAALDDVTNPGFKITAPDAFRMDVIRLQALVRGIHMQTVRRDPSALPRQRLLGTIVRLSPDMVAEMFNGLPNMAQMVRLAESDEGFWGFPLGDVLRAMTEAQQAAEDSSPPARLVIHHRLTADEADLPIVHFLRQLFGAVDDEDIELSSQVPGQDSHELSSHALIYRDGYIIDLDTTRSRRLVITVHPPSAADQLSSDSHPGQPVPEEVINRIRTQVLVAFMDGNFQDEFPQLTQRELVIRYSDGSQMCEEVFDLEDLQRPVKEIEMGDLAPLSSDEIRQLNTPVAPPDDPQPRRSVPEEANFDAPEPSLAFDLAGDAVPPTQAPKASADPDLDFNFDLDSAEATPPGLVSSTAFAPLNLAWYRLSPPQQDLIAAAATRRFGLGAHLLTDIVASADSPFQPIIAGFNHWISQDHPDLGVARGDLSLRAKHLYLRSFQHVLDETLTSFVVEGAPDPTVQGNPPVPLHVEVHFPKNSAPTAVVFLIPDVGESVGCHAWMIDTLVGKGFAVVGMDARFQGLSVNSAGMDGTLDSLGNVMGDIEKVLAQVKQDERLSSLSWVGMGVGQSVVWQTLLSKMAPQTFKGLVSIKPDTLSLSSEESLFLNRLAAGYQPLDADHRQTVEPYPTQRLGSAEDRVLKLIASSQRPAYIQKDDVLSVQAEGIAVLDRLPEPNLPQFAVRYEDDNTVSLATFGATGADGNRRFDSQRIGTATPTSHLGHVAVGRVMAEGIAKFVSSVSQGPELPPAAGSGSGTPGAGSSTPRLQTGGASSLSAPRGLLGVEGVTLPDEFVEVLPPARKATLPVPAWLRLAPAFAGRPATEFSHFRQTFMEGAAPPRQALPSGTVIPMRAAVQAGGVVYLQARQQVASGAVLQQGAAAMAGAGQVIENEDLNSVTISREAARVSLALQEAVPVLQGLRQRLGSYYPSIEAELAKWRRSDQKGLLPSLYAQLVKAEVNLNDSMQVLSFLCAQATNGLSLNSVMQQVATQTAGRTSVVSGATVQVQAPGTPAAVRPAVFVGH